MSGTRRFSGHAAVFGSPTMIGAGHDSFWEQVDPRAFDRAIREGQDVRLLVNHDPNLLLARTRSGTLRLSATKRGLKTEATLPDTGAARDVAALLERRDLSQMSFGFIPTKERWDATAGGRQVRTIVDCDLLDVSIVTYPAYEDTDCQLLTRAELEREVRLKQLRLKMLRLERDGRIMEPPDVTRTRKRLGAHRARLEMVRRSL